MKAHFANMIVLSTFMLRRDRVRIPIWVISIVGISIAVALSFPGIYPPGPARDILAQTLENPAMVSMIGPSYGQNDYHMGAVMAHQMFLFTAIAVAIMNILLAIRHTRSDEELGRVELVRSLPVGRLTNAGATLYVLSLTNIVIAISLTVGLGVLGLEGMGWSGSFLYGMSLAVIGTFFAATTVFIAQLTETSRGAFGFSFSFLGISYLLRAIGDVSSEVLSLISPLGLILRTQVYVNNCWWPILVLLVISAAFTWLAFRFSINRDLGAGLIATKPGRVAASPCLKCPLGLTLRLQKITIIGWTIGMFVLGASYGSVFGDLDAFFKTSDIFELLLPGTAGFSLTDQFIATLLSVITMIGAIPVLLIFLKIKSEEQLGRTEHLLTRVVFRWNLLGSYLITAIFMSIAVQLAATLGLWFAISTVLEDAYALKWILKGAFSYLPILWITLGFAVLLFGFIPRLSGVVWIHLGYTFFVIYLGGLLKLPRWMGKLTPFGYIPHVPLETMGFQRVIFMLILAIILIGIGFLGYQKRDVQG